MFWAIVLIGAVIAFFKFPAFRKATIIITVVLMFLIVGYIVNEKSQTEASRKMVSIHQLELTDMRLGAGSYNKSAYQLTGRIKNNSSYSVFTVKAKIHVLDCDEQSHCEVIGEDEENISPLIPPGQVRDINETFFFSSAMHVRGKFQWNYTITEIQGRPYVEGDE